MRLDEGKLRNDLNGCSHPQCHHHFCSVNVISHSTEFHQIDMYLLASPQFGAEWI